jgi:hypothetical protein
MNKLKSIKIFLDIPLDDSSRDEKLLLLIDNVTHSILNYCNISKLPSELEHTLVNMVVAIFRDLYMNDHKIVSASDGDSSVSYSYSDRITGLIFDYREELNRFKQFYKRVK